MTTTSKKANVVNNSSYRHSMHTLFSSASPEELLQLLDTLEIALVEYGVNNNQDARELSTHILLLQLLRHTITATGIAYTIDVERAQQAALTQPNYTLQAMVAAMMPIPTSEHN